MTSTPFTFISKKIIDAMEWVSFKKTATWCTENVYLNTDVSPRPGYMGYEKYPWVEEVLNDWDKVHIWSYNIMASTQIAKTTMQLAVMAKSLGTDPCMMQFSIPNDSDVPVMLRKKIDPFFRGVKSLQNKMKVRATEETTRMMGAVKEVPNGTLFITGNTESSRKSNTVKYLFLDEVQLFEPGDVKEFIGRTKSFSKTGRKVFIASSRRFKGDEIQKQHDNSYCKKELMVECKACGEYFYPTSKHFNYMSIKEYKESKGIEKLDNLNDYKREAIETAHIACFCGENKIYSKDIEDLVENKKVKLKIVEGSEEDSIYGYKINAMATGLTSYSEMAEGLIEAGSDEKEIATIYRDYFNEIFEVKSDMTTSSDILMLSNDYEEFEVPDDTLGLYMGVDSQKGYYWVTIMAIEYQLKTHLVYCGKVLDLAELESLMDREYRYKDGTIYYPGIRRAYHDYQGYKTPQKDIIINEDTGEMRDENYLDMPTEVKDFAYRMAVKYGADSEGRERYYAVIGEQTLTNDEVFKMVNTTLKVKGYASDRKIKTLKVNVTSTKLTFMKMVSNHIKKQKATEDDAAYYWEERLHFINKTLHKFLSNRKGDGERTHYDKQITSEVWTRNKKGYMFFDNPKQLDNHYFDCNSYIMIAIQQDQLANMPKPERQASIKEDIEAMKSYLL